jgi:hypothetical protein
LIEKTQRKLREAQFFYRHLVDESARRIISDPEAFTHYFSAFLSAASSVTWFMKKEENEKYLAWKPGFDKTLTPEERRLLKLTRKLRNEAVKRAGGDPIVEWEEIAITGLLSGSFDLERQHPAYGMHRSSNPGFPPPTAKTMRPAFYLEDENGKATVTAKCREYLDYLEKMVREFLVAHS